MNKLDGKNLEEWREISVMLKSLNDPKLNSAAQQLDSIVSSIEILQLSTKDVSKNTKSRSDQSSPDFM